jgi:hypothetical protein
LAGAVKVGAAKFPLLDEFHVVTKMKASMEPRPVA